MNYVMRQVPILRARAERNYWTMRMFENVVVRNLEGCDLFNGWCSSALESMRKAKSLGAVTVLNTGSVHIATQKQMLEEEYAAFGLRRVVTDQRLVDQGVQEFEEADHIIVASTFVKRSLLDRGIPDRKISIVPDGVTRLFSPGRKTDDVFRVIAVGRIEFRKGIQYLLQAFRDLRLPNAELLLVGGPQPEFDALLNEYRGWYRLTGRVSDAELARWYNESSVFVLPSIEDGWGHVTLEAMSSGLPVIVSANAGSADAVEQGKSGFVVPARDVDTLKARLLELYESAELRRAMGAEAAAAARTRTWDEYGHRNLAVFKRVLGRPSDVEATSEQLETLG
ncbi:MAG: glycosyltransferase family 4 protein [Vicinamibacterales bacterium]